MQGAACVQRQWRMHGRTHACATSCRAALGPCAIARIRAAPKPGRLYRPTQHPNRSNRPTDQPTQVRLVLEYADKGNLRDALDQGAFFGRGFDSIRVL
jgi:hypothetical protein